MEARANKLGVTPAEAEALTTPTAHLAETTSIAVDASGIGFLAAYLASDKSWAITGGDYDRQRHWQCRLRKGASGRQSTLLSCR